MSTQYTDGSWSEIEPLHDALKIFEDAVENGTLKKFVAGSKEEIKKEQKEEALSQRLNELEVELDEIKARQDQSFVAVPDKAEIEKYGVPSSAINPLTGKIQL